MKHTTLLLLIMFAAFVLVLDCAMVVRPIHKRNSKNVMVDGIFQNATIHKSQNEMALYLSDRVVNLLNVPDVMQATEYTCGPSSLSAVLGYYQFYDWRESELALRAKTTEQYGTAPQNLYATIKSLGLGAQMREGMTIADLQFYVRNKQPVIILFQAWGDEGTDYKNDWEDGHFVVVIGYDKDYLYFEDPWILGSIGYISKRQFPDRWHDIVGGLRKVYNLGIVLKAEPKTTPVIVKLQ